MRINVNTIARKVDVDNRIPLRYYYRIADNLLKQKWQAFQCDCRLHWTWRGFPASSLTVGCKPAFIVCFQLCLELLSFFLHANIYREEKNIVDLYIILLRYSSLVSETIPFHRDYQGFLLKEKVTYKKRLLAVLDELESLKPGFLCQVDELNRARAGAQLLELDWQDKASHGSVMPSYLQWPSNREAISSMDIKRPANVAIQSSWKHNNDRTQVNFANMAHFDKSLNLPTPNKETLSRHSILGPSSLQGQWHGPSTEIKVHYPNNMDLIPAENSSLNQAGQFNTLALKDGDLGGISSSIESVLSLDDGRWSHAMEELCPPLINEAREDPFQFVSIKHPFPPPVLAEVQQDFAPISPSKVADPRPGPAKHSQDGPPNTNSYQHLHVPVTMMEDFLRLAWANTEKNLETCGVLAGSLKNRVFHITTLIIPKQESTSDSCSTLNEEDIFEVQDRLSLFPLGWIHTHPTQTCFMSSVDLHTHYSYQIMLPEAIAIIMAPNDPSSPLGIFHLSDPGGLSVIRNCQQRGFHPHEETSDGSSIYEHCSHVFMNPKLKFDVVDLR